MILTGAYDTARMFLSLKPAMRLLGGGSPASLTLPNYLV